MSNSADQKTARVNPVDMATTFAEVAQRASRLLARSIERRSRMGLSVARDELGIAQAFMELSAHVLTNPYRLAQTQMRMFWDYFSLWQRSTLKMIGMPALAPVAEPIKGDNRFRDADWEQDFLFDFIKQSYLITARHLHDTVCCREGISEATQQKINFFTRQYIDALSPSNFALTNPEVFRETIRTHGQNLVKGLNNLLQDIESGDGRLRIRMTDMQAFELGKNVATTPGKVIFQNELMQLIQYSPTTEKQFRRPLLIVPPWINKFYILDLRQKNSLVKWATDQGHTTFIISWVNPDEKLAHKTFADYVQQGLLTALEQIESATGEKLVDLAGYCLGGTLLMTTLAWLAARKEKRAASATFFTTMLDFSDPGELGVFIDERIIAGLERRMERRGYLDGHEMAGAFNLMRANDLVWSFVVNNYLLGRDPFPFDLLYWNSDSTRMPAAMHSFYLRNMYVNNAFKEPGGVEVAGVPIDIGKVNIPCYFISAIEDHIAPWKSTYLGARLPKGPVKFVLGGSGHIAGIVNPPSAGKYGYWLNESTDGSLPAEPEAFLAGAEYHPGSWWTHWESWLRNLPKGSETVPARVPGSGALPAIEDAPGSYVRLRIDGVKTA